MRPDVSADEIGGVEGRHKDMPARSGFDRARRIRESGQIRSESSFADHNGRTAWLTSPRRENFVKFSRSPDRSTEIPDGDTDGDSA